VRVNQISLPVSFPVRALEIKVLVVIESIGLLRKRDLARQLPNRVLLSSTLNKEGQARITSKSNDQMSAIK